MELKDSAVSSIRFSSDGERYWLPPDDVLDGVDALIGFVVGKVKDHPEEEELTVEYADISWRVFASPDTESDQRMWLCIERKG